MTYYYETLGPERFQQLALALFAKSFPDVQCLLAGMELASRATLKGPGAT